MGRMSTSLPCAVTLVADRPFSRPWCRDPTLPSVCVWWPVSEPATDDLCSSDTYRGLARLDRPPLQSNALPRPTAVANYQSKAPSGSMSPPFPPACTAYFESEYRPFSPSHTRPLLWTCALLHPPSHTHPLHSAPALSPFLPVPSPRPPASAPSRPPHPPLT